LSLKIKLKKTETKYWGIQYSTWGRQ